MHHYETPTTNPSRTNPWSPTPHRVRAMLAPNDGAACGSLRWMRRAQVPRTLPRRPVRRLRNERSTRARPTSPRLALRQSRGRGGPPRARHRGASTRVRDPDDRLNVGERLGFYAIACTIAPRPRRRPGTGSPGLVGESNRLRRTLLWTRSGADRAVDVEKRVPRESALRRRGRANLVLSPAAVEDERRTAPSPVYLHVDCLARGRASMRVLSSAPSRESVLVHEVRDVEWRKGNVSWRHSSQ